MAARVGRWSEDNFRCPQCRVVKPAACFYVNLTKTEGISHCCKLCHRENQRPYREREKAARRAARRARGLRKPGRRKFWTRERIIVAIQAWPRCPTSTEWTAADRDHPATSTVLREFGTWRAATKAAGRTG